MFMVVRQAIWDIDQTTKVSSVFILFHYKKVKVLLKGINGVDSAYIKFIVMGFVTAYIFPT